MEKRKRRRRRRLISCQFVLLILVLSSFTLIQCQENRNKITRHLLSASSPPPSASSHFKNGVKRILMSISLGVLTGLTGSILFAYIVRCLFRYINRTPILKGPVVFSPKISPKTLQLALSRENQNHLLLGSSSNGKYYKTVLDNGLTSAVKRLEPFEADTAFQSSKAVKRKIQQELERLASLRHRNVMSLRAYVRECDRFSLVYDYVPNGSLEDAMNRVRENQLQLGWEVRLRIAVGVVKGLRYLHFECIPQILHCNLKPTNVLLDGEFEARLGDSGLAKLLPNLDTTRRRRRTSSSVYSAPECFLDCCRYTDKSDVFSFGMILGVLLTGRDPSDPFFGETGAEGGGGGGSLGRWLRNMEQAGEAREALDKKTLIDLGGGEPDEMLMALRIAIVCLSDLPQDRPSSDELVLMLSQLHSF